MLAMLTMCQCVEQSEQSISNTTHPQDTIRICSRANTDAACSTTKAKPLICHKNGYNPDKKHKRVKRLRSRKMEQFKSLLFLLYQAKKHLEFMINEQIPPYIQGARSFPQIQRFGEVSQL